MNVNIFATPFYVFNNHVFFIGLFKGIEIKGDEATLKAIKNKIYLHEFKKGFWLDCRSHAACGFCPLSLVNDCRGVKDQFGQPLTENCDFNFVKTNHAISGVKLTVKKQIKAEEELAYNYGEKFNKTGADADNKKIKLYDHTINMFIKKENHEVFYNTVQGDGYCSLLVFLQEAFARPKIHLERLIA